MNALQRFITVFSLLFGHNYSRSKNCCKDLQNSGFTAGFPWVLHQTIPNFDCLYLNGKCIYSSIIGYGQWLLVEFEIAKGSIMNIRHFLLVHICFK